MRIQDHTEQNRDILPAEGEEQNRGLMDKSSDSPGWRCDTYCRKVRHVACEGRSGVREGAEALCPYYDEMLY